MADLEELAGRLDHELPDVAWAEPDQIRERGRDRRRQRAVVLAALSVLVIAAAAGWLATGTWSVPAGPYPSGIIGPTPSGTSSPTPSGIIGSTPFGTIGATPLGITSPTPSGANGPIPSGIGHHRPDAVGASARPRPPSLIRLFGRQAADRLCAVDRRC
ncbi:hypothetical protein AB0J74_29610 [Asanoa sp. NPDC049573]|uniref:hypothetical protein n=1 Tax=Asanoa sp. NPDC049573 TaxID=3155396 RepID=UPI0034360DDB